LIAGTGGLAAFLALIIFALQSTIAKSVPSAVHLPAASDDFPHFGQA
jgi:hypothetical protein